MRWLLVLCAGAGWLQGQDAKRELAPETILLARVRMQALENLQRQPDYTCVETVERSRRGAATKKYQSLDTLRLEVGLVDGKEVFGWPGAKKFEDSDVTKLVTTGAIGNGNFATHAKAIFEGQSAMFTYRGAEPVNDHAAVRFDYRVPQMMSGYQIHVPNHQAVVGYHGSVYADPKSLDVERLVVVADDIPVELDLAGAATRLDYSRVAIGDGQFLLPEASEMKMTHLDGTEDLNRVRLASCRQFTGDSVLTFGDAPAKAAAVPVAQIELPAQMDVELGFLDDIDTRTAAVGDPVRARLQHDLKRGGRVFFSKGATAAGRISRLERTENFIVLGVEFSEIESSEARATVKMTLEDVGGRVLFEPDVKKFRPPPAHAGEGILFLRPERFNVIHGTLMIWRTS